MFRNQSKSFKIDKRQIKFKTEMICDLLNTSTMVSKATVGSPKD